MIETPVVLSPPSMAEVIGDAPLQRGKRLGWTLAIPLTLQKGNSHK